MPHEIRVTSRRYRVIESLRALGGEEGNLCAVDLVAPVSRSPLPVAIDAHACTLTWTPVFGTSTGFLGIVD